MTATLVSRRDFLHGRSRPQAPIRPPWSPGEGRFRSACDGCWDCIRVCREHILRPGAGGLPEAGFDESGCSLCGDCLRACAGKVLIGDPERDRPWAFQVGIGAGCLATAGVVCRACGDCCDTGAIRFRPRVGGPALPALDPQRCNACGQCLSRCPTGAIGITQGLTTADHHEQAITMTTLAP